MTDTLVSVQGTTESSSVPPTLDAQLGKRLQQARKAWNWSQKRLADHLHIDPSAVSRMEGGHQAISLALAVKIAEALGISVLELIRPPSVTADVQESLAALQSAVGASRETLAGALSAVVTARDALEDVSDFTRRSIVGNDTVEEFLAKKVTESAEARGNVTEARDRELGLWRASLVPGIATGIIRTAAPES